MQNKHHPLNPGYFYHIYPDLLVKKNLRNRDYCQYVPQKRNGTISGNNRGDNRENLFYKPDNYICFFKKYDQYLNAYPETYTFCLLPNHFHLLVRVKEVGTDAIAPGEGILTKDRKEKNDTKNISY